MTYLTTGFHHSSHYVAVSINYYAAEQEGALRWNIYNAYSVMSQQVIKGSV